MNTWKNPTSILYGGQDDLQTLEIVKNFAEEQNCSLTISETSKHAFMENKDIQIVSEWLKQNI